MGKPKISLIVLAYNAERYLKDVLLNLLNQTFQDIEIVVVDDGSSDQTAEILMRYAKRESRIKVVTHASNQKCLAAHVSGIMASSAEYCTFVAADDFLAPETCERCWSVVKDREIDILHFGFDPFPDDGVALTEVDRASILSFSRPHDGGIVGCRAIGDACFVSKSISWNVAGKLLNTDVCRRACANLDNLELNFAEDCYLFYFICLEAQSYWGLPDSDYYRYRIGSGISQNKKLKLDAFVSICACGLAFDSIASFLKKSGLENSYEAQWYRSARFRVLGDVIDRLMNYMLDGKGSQAFSILIKAWGAAEVAAFFDSSPWVDDVALAEGICDVSSTMRSLEDGIRLSTAFNLSSDVVDVERLMHLLENCDILFDSSLNEHFSVQEIERSGQEGAQLIFEHLTTTYLHLEHLYEVKKINVALWLDCGTPLTLGVSLLLKVLGVRLVVIWREDGLFPVDWPACTFLPKRLRMPFFLLHVDSVLCSEQAVHAISVFNSNTHACDITNPEGLALSLLHTQDCSRSTQVIHKDGRVLYKNLLQDMERLLNSQSACWRGELEWLSNQNTLLLDETRLLRESSANLVASIDELSKSASYKIGSSIVSMPSRLKSVITKHK